VRLAAQLKRQAREQVIAFWLAHGIDDEYGPYPTRASAFASTVVVATPSDRCGHKGREQPHDEQPSE
jgi:hypothetical protein